MGKLEGKVALITGGGSGIGRATAILLANEGAKVAIADWVAEGAEDTVRTIKAAGGEAIFIEADVSKAKDAENMVKATVDTYGQLDILFNNAGIEQPLALTADTSEEVWDKVISVNLKGVFLGMKYGILEMLKRGGGMIINTASMCGLVGVTYLPAYNASKGGVVILTKTAALEYVGQNIRVNCVCPAPVKTPLLDRIRSDPKWPEVGPTRQSNPMVRLGTPEEVAQAVLFLASDESSYINGLALSVDGGHTAQ